MVRVGGTKRFPLHNNNHNTERLLGTVRCSGSSVCVTHKSLTRPTLFYAHFPDEEGSSADSGWFEGQGNILCLLAHLSGWIQFFKHRLAPNNSFCLVMGLRKKLVGEDCYVFVSMGSDKYFVCIFHFSTLKKTPSLFTTALLLFHPKSHSGHDQAGVSTPLHSTASPVLPVKGDSRVGGRTGSNPGMSGRPIPLWSSRETLLHLLQL